MIKESAIKLYFLTLLKEFPLFEFSLRLIEELREANRPDLIGHDLLYIESSLQGVVLR